MNVAAHPETALADPATLGALVERVCASSELRRATRLRDFLHYVSRRVLHDPGTSVTEQEIGVHVFDRRPDYDTGIDNIVRVNASELRKRITAYFATEGTHEPIWFEIPRGSYTPVFMPRPVDSAAPPAGISAPRPLPESVAPAGAVSSSSTRQTATLRAIAIVLALLCGWLGLQLRSARRSIDPWRNQPALSAFWSQILDSPRPTEIVLADTSFALAEDVLRRPVSLTDYLNHSYVQQLATADLPDSMKSEMQLLVSRSNGSYGDFRAAERILSLGPHSDHLKLEYARSLRADVLKTENLVLVGSSYSNPWSALFESRLNFRILNDPVTHQMQVINSHPASGEQPVYTTSLDPRSPVGYSVVACVPGEAAGHTDALILAGTTAEATEAAGDFITAEDSMRRLEFLLHARSLHHFEVLLRTTKLDGTPLSADIVAVRAYP